MRQPSILIFGLAFILGLRYGIDWDHIAALTDITGSEEKKKQSFVLSFFYILGHAAVIITLGFFAVIIGVRLPSWVDTVMEPFVGTTLILLSIYLIVTILIHGKNFRMKSRWMLLFSLIHTIVHVVKEKLGHHHDHKPANLPDKYRHHTAFTIGIIHGIGAETPTQLLLFITAAGVGGSLVGSLLVATFVFGLVCSNTLISILSIVGYSKARENSWITLSVGIITSVFSLIVGLLFLFHRATLLPALLGG